MGNPIGGSVDAAPGVRVLVAEASPSLGRSEGSALRAALEPLVRGGFLESVPDLRSCLERCRTSDVDLVVVDEGLGRDAEEIVERLRRSGPPVLVLQRVPADAAALAWFRRGAADCVAADAELAGLRRAAREQLERWRSARRGAPGELAIDWALSPAPADGEPRPDPGEAERERHAQVLQTAKMASIGQLAAGVAHEINNPMGFIHANLFQMSEYVADLRQVWGRVESLQKAVDAGEASAVGLAAGELREAVAEVDLSYVLQDLAKAIRESQEGSERIRHIVQDLRDFSYQDTGERVLSDINQALDSTANIVWPMMKHLVELEKDYAELPPVPCYPMQLKQVFMNLLVNAYQAIEEAVGSSGKLGRVSLSTARYEGGVCIGVADTGVGIPADKLDRIFEPFYTTKKVGSGTGLGLSTSYSIVKRHGGTVSVESTPGRGTRFSIRLPLLGEEIGGAA